MSSCQEPTSEEPITRHLNVALPAKFRRAGDRPSLLPNKIFLGLCGAMWVGISRSSQNRVPLGNDRFVKLVISITRDFIDLGYIIVIHWGPKKEDAMITLSLIAVVGTFFLLVACALSSPPPIPR